MTFYFFRFVKYNNYIFLALMKIYGVGLSVALDILGLSAVKPLTFMYQVSFWKMSFLTEFLLHNFLIDFELRKFLRNNIKSKVVLGSYHGLRFKFRLPVRGQRTKTNSKTAARLNFFKFDTKYKG